MRGLRARIGDREVRLQPGEELLLGRDDDSALRSTNQYVSRRHAVVRTDASGWYIQDVGSTHGMFHEGRRVQRLAIDGPVTVVLGQPERGDVLNMELLPEPAPASEGVAVAPAPTVMAGGRGRAWLEVVSGPGGGKRLEISDEGLIIGRDPGCDLVLSDRNVSRRHARLSAVDGRIFVEDLGSQNGVLVDGRAVRGKTELSEGGTVHVGMTALRVSWQPRSGPVAAAPGPILSASSVARLREQVSMLRRGQSRSRLFLAGGLAAAVVVALGGVAVVALMPRQATLRDIIAAVRPSTVSILVEVEDEWLPNGTGWVYDSDEGLVMTNYHVIDGAGELAVGVDGEPRDATIVATAECEDLALLQITDTSGLVEMQLGSQSKLEQGDRVVVLGFPDSLGPPDSSDLTATQGIVSVVRKTIVAVRQDGQVYTDVIQTDAAINPGNSGGPLVNEQTELVGVNTWALTSSLLTGRDIEGQGYAIGVDHVKEVAPLLRAGTSIACATDGGG